MASILIIDDSATMRMIVVSLLKAEGHETVECGNGAEALQTTSAKVFDLIITDLNMPGMDGISLIKQLRKQPNHRDIPIVTLTTETSAEIEQQVRDAGATGWLSKPFSSEGLLQMMKKLI